MLHECKEKGLIWMHREVLQLHERLCSSDAIFSAVIGVHAVEFCAKKIPVLNKGVLFIVIL